MFKDVYGLAWEFHHNTCRWPHNLLAPTAPDAPPDAAFKEYLDAPFIGLPAGALPAVTLGEAIERRASCRRFVDEPLQVPQLAALLQCGYGVHGRYKYGEMEMAERTVPSGGGLYPLEIYVLARRVAGVEAGCYHYAALAHGLERLPATLPPSSFVGDLFLGQPYAGAAPLLLVFTARIGRTMAKYKERGYRYILFEAGHAAQNVNLAVAALGLGAVNLGGFFDSVLAALLGLDEEKEVPLYGMAVGVPAAGLSRVARREP